MKCQICEEKQAKEIFEEIAKIFRDCGEMYSEACGICGRITCKKRWQALKKKHGVE